MDRHCSHCGFPVGEQLRCPLCNTGMVRVNLRRTLLWALVVEEYLVALVILVRFR